MLVLGLQGSPRKKGNSDFLLSLFMEQARELGAQTRVIETDKKHILPCKEYTTCERKGFCPIKDDMKHEIYGLLREAEVIVVATPVFFFNVPAQLKSLIDRCQTFWARKYKLGLSDPGQKTRKGFLLAAGASRGKNLFDGIHLTLRYFFDAVGAEYAGSLTYRNIEAPGDMEKHPGVREEVKAAATMLLKPFAGRKKILFACRENACRSQMAGAFARYLAGDKFEVFTAGSTPAEKINPLMMKVMAEKGIDMEFRKPESLQSVLESVKPDMLVTMGCGEQCPFIPGTEMRDWDLPDPAGQDIDFMRNVRDKIEKQVISLINEGQG